MKIGLKSFTPTQAAAIRIFLAALVFLPFSIRELKNLRKSDIKYLLVAGFVGSFIPAFLFTKAQTRIDSALAGMLNSLTPVFTLIVGILIHRLRTHLAQVVGLILGFLGAIGLITFGENLSLSHINYYAFFIVVATLCYAVSVNIVKMHLTHLRGVQITALSMLFIGPAALIILLTSDLSQVIGKENWYMHFTALAILGIIGTAFAMLIMYSMIRYTSAVFASSVTYIIPGFAIFWGILDNEQVTAFQLGCIALILIGVYLINRRR